MKFFMHLVLVSCKLIINLIFWLNMKWCVLSCMHNQNKACFKYVWLCFCCYFTYIVNGVMQSVCSMVCLSNQKMAVIVWICPNMYYACYQLHMQLFITLYVQKYITFTKSFHYVWTVDFDTLPFKFWSVPVWNPGFVKHLHLF